MNNGTLEKREPTISSKWPQIIITMPEQKQEEAPQQIVEQKRMNFIAALFYASGLIAIGWYIIAGWRMM